MFYIPINPNNNKQDSLKAITLCDTQDLHNFHGTFSKRQSCKVKNQYWSILQSGCSTAFWTLTQEFEVNRKCDLRWEVKNCKNFLFEFFPGKSNINFFEKIQNTLFWGPFCPSKGIMYFW